MLTERQIIILLGILKQKYGFGYSDDPEIAQLQAMLSIMLEVRQRSSEPVVS
jgi:hypothetical protein